MLVWVLCGGGSSVQHRVYTITPTITTHSNIRYSVVFYKSYDFFELDFIVVGAIFSISFIPHATQS